MHRLLCVYVCELRMPIPYATVFFVRVGMFWNIELLFFSLFIMMMILFLLFCNSTICNRMMKSRFCSVLLFCARCILPPPIPESGAANAALTAFLINSFAAVDVADDE